MVRRRMKDDILELLDGEENVVLSAREFLRDGTFVVQLRGRLKNELAHAVEDELSAAICAHLPLELDLHELEYLAGMGIRALMNVQQLADETEGAAFRLVNVPARLAAQLRSVGFSAKIETENV